MVFLCFFKLSFVSNNNKKDKNNVLVVVNDWSSCKVLTMPYRRSSALRRMDSSLSSKHCSTRSLWACTLFGWVFRILDMASKPRYFTETNGIAYFISWIDMTSKPRYFTETNVILYYNSQMTISQMTINQQLTGELHLTFLL